MSTIRHIPGSIRAVRQDENLRKYYTVDDFSEWTQFEWLPVRDCAYLFIGYDPDCFGVDGQQELWAVSAIIKLVRTAIVKDTIHTLGRRQPVAQQQMKLRSFVCWLRDHKSISLDAAPALLVELGLNPRNASKRKPQPGSVPDILYAEFVRALKALADKGNRNPSLKGDVLRYTEKFPGDYPECTRPGRSDANILRRVREVGKPKQDPEYLAFLTKENKKRRPR